jgi:hypothetical protein
VRPNDRRGNRKEHLPGIYEFLDAACDGAEVWNILRHIAEQPDDFDADFGHIRKFVGVGLSGGPQGEHSLVGCHGGAKVRVLATWHASCHDANIWRPENARKCELSAAENWLKMRLQRLFAT